MTTCRSPGRELRVAQRGLSGLRLSIQQTGPGIIFARASEAATSSRSRDRRPAQEPRVAWNAQRKGSRLSNGFTVHDRPLSSQIMLEPQTTKNMSTETLNPKVSRRGDAN